jgi:hypothetical protein
MKDLSNMSVGTARGFIEENLNADVIDAVPFEEQSPFALSKNIPLFRRVRTAIADWRRDKKNRAIANRFPKQRIKPWPDHGFSVLTEPMKNNGLCRAYRYEVERLKAEGLYNPKSRNVLILGQPRQWRKLFKNAPQGFENTYRIGLWVTEFDVMPPDWAFAINVVNEIWTPSTFSPLQALLPVRVLV